MRSDETSMNQAFLQKVTEIVEGNLQNEQFGVEDLSAEAGFSRSQLHRKLKALLGKSVSRFIREIRLEKAMLMLKNDESTASEIAYHVGFGSPSYFYKCFHKYYGFPPGEVRKLLETGELSNQFDTVEIKSLHKGSYDSSYAAQTLPLGIRVKKYQSVVFIPIIALCLIFIGIYRFQKKALKKVKSAEKSIAILPFSNLSSDEENQHFADGLVDDLLMRLSLIKEFKVISRTSSETFKGKNDKKIPEIASELGANYILEGSVQKHDDKIRIIVQFIDAQNDDHIWVKTFDRDMADFFNTQSEIAMQVASGLSMMLTEQQTIDVRKNQTDNIKAMELYQLGRHNWGKRTIDGLNTAIAYFEMAIIEDPEYALAYAGLADTYYLSVFFDEKEKSADNRVKALGYANKALEIDPELVEAYTVLASVYSFLDGNWQAAEEQFIHGISLNGNYSTLHHRYSEHLMITDRSEKSREQINKALSIDPLSFIVRMVSAENYYHRGYFKEALNELQICQDLILHKFHLRLYDLLFLVYSHLENGDAAFETYKQIEKNSFPEVSDINVIDSLYHALGYFSLIGRYADLSKDNVTKAYCYAFLGNKEKSIFCLEKAVNNDAGISGIWTSYEFMILHDDSQYIALLNKIGLPWSPDSTNF